MHSICLITCYMGPLPNYFSYFISSCRKNKDIHFVVISDSVEESKNIDNVQLIKLNLSQLSELSSLKLQTTVKVANAWKINEYKPAFGVIFDDIVKDYDFWGWCDLDIIWGNVRSFLTSDLLNKYDVIVPKDKWTAGHFTLFRNNNNNNNLFRLNEDVIALFNSEKYYAFEESCHRWEGDIYSFEWLKSQGLPISMFDIVKHEEKRGVLKAYFKDVIREHPQPIHYLYENGKLIDLKNQEEFMYYHLLTIKKIWRFYIPSYKVVPDVLHFTPYGIISNKEEKSFFYKAIWTVNRFISCMQGIRKSIKNQNIRLVIKKGIKEVTRK